MDWKMDNHRLCAETPKEPSFSEDPVLPAWLERAMAAAQAPFVECLEEELNAKMDNQPPVAAARSHRATRSTALDPFEDL